MSSMAAGSDHMDHVRTQMPYALLVGTVSCLLGYIPAGFGFSPFLSFLSGLLVLTLLLWLLGRCADPPAQPAPPPAAGS